MISPSTVPSTVPSSVASGADDQDVPGADDDPGQHVAADLVGAEPVRAGRAVVDRQQLLGVAGSCGAIAVPNTAHTTQNSRMDDADQEGRPAQQQPPRRGRGGPAGVRDGDRAWRRRRDVRHAPAPVRSRGLSTVDSTSAMSVATMYTTPIVRIPASSIGKSFAFAAR